MTEKEIQNIILDSLKDIKSDQKTIIQKLDGVDKRTDKNSFEIERVKDHIEALECDEGRENVLQLRENIKVLETSDKNQSWALRLLYSGLVVGIVARLLMAILTSG